MNDDLRALGDELELAISNEIASGRNRTVPLRHVPAVHNSTAQEAHMLTADPETTATPGDTAGVGPVRARRSRRVVAIAALATIAVGGAAAATAYRLSDDEVSKGLPGGSAIFEGTNPSCTSSDGIVFDCTLESAPTQETADDYTGNAQVFIDSTSRVAGGCRGVSADGLQWICYAGERAVTEEIIGPDFLGELVLAPGRG